MKKLSLSKDLPVIGISPLIARTKVITGTITSSAEGEDPLPGVTVRVMGTKIFIT